MSRKQISIVGLFILIITLIWWFLKPSRPQTNQSVTSPTISTQSIEPKSLSLNQLTNSKNRITLPPGTIEREKEKRKQAIESIKQIFQTPITFHGKVIDQNGDPVPQAKVTYGALDKFWESGTDYQGSSDSNGLFSISGIKGGALLVAVQKEGYYPFDRHSAAGFSATMVPTPELMKKLKPPYEGGYDKPLPTQDNPAIFVLHKMGETEPLIKIGTGGVVIPKDGTPKEINFANGGKQAGSQTALRVEAWTSNEGLTANQPYDWRCRISIPGGGLIERKGEFDFEAPLEGYQLADEVVMRQNDKPWKNRFKKEYFAKFPNDTYGRFKIEFVPGGDLFLF